MAEINRAELNELLEIKAKHDRMREINKQSYKKRQAIIRLKCRWFDEQVEKGVRGKLTKKEIAAEMR